MVSRKLDQLTSMRFVASAAIVFHHSVGLFGLGHFGFNLGVGVSFFFVLSGFILTYVYKYFDSKQAIKEFFRARFARLYPAYIFTTILGFYLVDWPLEYGKLIPFLLMMQGFIPDSAYYFSYNAVAWSISTEVGFYLIFPILLLISSKRRYAVILMGLMSLFLLMTIAADLPAYIPPAREFNITQHGLLYISPLSRVFEFILGMLVAILFNKPLKSHPDNSFVVFTVLEFSVFILAFTWMIYGRIFIAQYIYSDLPENFWSWYVHAGAGWAFAILIFIMAHGEGLFSKILMFKPFVLLGEISFSMYLVHQIYLNYYRANNGEFIVVDDVTAFGLFWVFLISSSYLIWKYVEMPGRLLLLGKQKVHADSILKAIIRRKDGRYFIDIIVFVFIIVGIAYLKK